MRKKRGERMKSADHILKQHIPCYSSMKKAGGYLQKRQQGKKSKRTRLTEINHNGKTVLQGKTTVAAAIRKLFNYEETGLTPYEVRNLIERERNLTERIKKLEDWQDE